MQSSEGLLPSPDTLFVPLINTYTYTFLIYFAYILTLSPRSLQYWVPLHSFDFYCLFFFFLLLSNSETLFLRRPQTKDVQPSFSSFCIGRNLLDVTINPFLTVLQLWEANKFISTLKRQVYTVFDSLLTLLYFMLSTCCWQTSYLSCLLWNGRKEKTLFTDLQDIEYTWNLIKNTFVMRLKMACQILADDFLIKNNDKSSIWEVRIFY